jgi:Flp pilus assembly protein TadG
MRMRAASKLLRLTREESGQSMAVLGFGVFLLLGLAGISIEIGHGYYALELLQASTDSATLAAAEGLPSASAAQTNADLYTAMANQYNRSGILTNVNATVTPICSATVASTVPGVGYGTPCQGAGVGLPLYNAVTVTQTAIISTWFGNFGPIHAPLFHLTAIGTAAMKGGAIPPYNIAVVMDTTASMGTNDPSGQCPGKTQEYCALQGFQDLLLAMQPCAVTQVCTSGTATPNDSVSLYVFPPILTSSVGADTDCSGGSPSAQKYTVPTLPASTTYQVVSFANGAAYRATDSSATLNYGNSLVNASGAGTGCTAGLGTPGGAGTYYAQAIYAAQTDLVNAQLARAGSDNIMIILSDGNATATAQAGDILPSTAGSLHGGKDTNMNDNGSGTNGDNLSTYPSNLGECGQAVQAAYEVGNLASKNNPGLDITQVYTIGYGSPNSSSNSNCGSDIIATTATSQPSPGGIWPGATQALEVSAGIAPKSPCAALAAMANLNANPGGAGSTGLPNFYSDAGAGCVSNNPYNAKYTSLTQIFQNIVGNLAHPKLIPNGTP